MSNLHSPRHSFVNFKFRHLRGWRRDLPDHRDFTLQVDYSVGALPPAADIMRLCGRIEDQGDIGSCTANASTSALEALARSGGRTLPELSRLYVYYYTRKVEGTPPEEDSGASLRNTMKTLVTFGAPAEVTWPYAADRLATAPTYRAIREAMRHRLARYYRCRSLDAVKRSIADGFPVVAGFQVPANMFDEGVTKTGVVPFPLADEGFIGGHAVMLMGYDDTQKRVVFANSWGSGWGNGGYGFLPYAYFEAGLVDDMWTLRTAA